MTAEVMMQDGIPWMYDASRDVYVLYTTIKMPPHELESFRGKPKEMIAEVMLRFGQALYSTQGVSQ
jgi:hypothetical protein